MQKLIFENSLGKRINLTSGYYGITNWEGLSNAELNIQSQSVPFHDGSVYLDSLLSEKDLNFTLALKDNNDLEKRYELKRELISHLNPKLGEGWLFYENDFINKKIKVISHLPIFENHNSNDAGTQKCPLTFTATNPYWENLNSEKENLTQFKLSTIMNNGDIGSNIKLKLRAINAENVEFDNLTTGKHIKIIGTVNDNVDINTNFGEKSATHSQTSFKYTSSNYILSLIYIPEKNKFFAVGHPPYATNYDAPGVILSSNDGVNWDFISRTEHKLNYLGYSPKLDLYVAVGYKTICISSDFENWTYIETFSESGSDRQISNYNFSSILWDSDTEKFIVAGLDNNWCLNSSDGINWNGVSLTNLAFYNEIKLNIVKKIGDYYYVVGKWGFIARSSDGINWTVLKTQMSTNDLFDIAYSNKSGIIVAVGNKIECSSDGENFDVLMNDTFHCRSIVFSEIHNLFVILAWGEDWLGKILTSSDGLTWNISNKNLGTNINIFKEKFITNYGYYSYDGFNWKYQFENLNQSGAGYIYSIAKKNNILFGLCYSNGIYWNIFKSLNGINWEKISDNVIARQSSYAFPLIKNLNNDLITIGQKYDDETYNVYGEVRKSLNGIDWETVFLSEINGSEIYDISFSEILNLYVAVGLDSNGAFTISGSDLNNLNLNYISNFTTNHPVKKIFSKNNYFYAFSDNKIFRSSDGINWTVIKEISTGNVYYFEKFNKFMRVNYSYVSVEGGYNYSVYVSLSSDGVNWVRYKIYSSIFTQGLTISSVAGYHNGEVYLALNFIGQGNVYLYSLLFNSIDCVDWKEFNVEFKYPDWVHLIENINDKFIFYFENKVSTNELRTSLILKEIQTDEENYISKISENSDMNLMLIPGENEIMLKCDSGNVNAIMEFNEKYIGV